MNFLRKLIIVLGVISMFLILNSGCIFITPDYDSYIVSYIKVTPSSATMQLGSSKKFKLLAYDSEDNLIPIDPSKVSWDFAFQCPLCTDVGEINPESGSISTYFTPKNIGRYNVYAHYKGKTDYSPVNVVQ